MMGNLEFRTWHAWNWAKGAAPDRRPAEQIGPGLMVKIGSSAGTSGVSGASGPETAAGAGSYADSLPVVDDHPVQVYFSACGLNSCC